MVDENPQPWAPEFENFNLDAKRMIMGKDKNGTFCGCPCCKTDGYLSDVNCPTQVGQTGYFGTYDNQCGRYLSSALNTTTLEQWAKEFLEYYIVDADDHLKKELLALEPKEVISVAYEAGFSLEISATPFEEEMW